MRRDLRPFLALLEAASGGVWHRPEQLRSAGAADAAPPRLRARQLQRRRRTVGGDSPSARVALVHLQRAIWLGCARKYVALLNASEKAPMLVTSLHFFSGLVEEVAELSRRLLEAHAVQSNPTGSDVEGSNSGIAWLRSNWHEVPEINFTSHPTPAPLKTPS